MEWEKGGGKERRGGGKGNRGEKVILGNEGFLACKSYNNSES